MTSFINQNQVVKNLMIGIGSESQISKVHWAAEQKGKEEQKIVTFQDSKDPEKISYKLFFRSLVPRLVSQCQGNCGNNLFPADKENYLVMKSRGCISFMNKQDEMDLKYCTLYIHFKAECLKE